MNSINFSLTQLYEDTKSVGERFILPTQDVFSSLEDYFYVLVDDVYYEVNIQKESGYVWFAFDYGKPNPIDDKLTNIITGDKKDNQRQNDEVELTNQLFIMYYFKNNTLYISNNQKKTLFEKVLLDKLERKFNVKNHYLSKEDFIKTIKSINKISFTEVKDLFSQDSKKRQALIDLTGTDSPERFSLEANYSKKTEIINFIRSLLESKSKYEIDSLIIQGTDENDFNFIFNVESFTQKISINVDKEDNGKFDSEKVKNNLLNEINK